MDNEYWKGFTAGREYERFIQSHESSPAFGAWVKSNFYGRDCVGCSNCGMVFARKKIFF